MSELFDNIRKTIHGDEAIGYPDDLQILDEGEKFITIWEFFDKRVPDRTYTIIDPDVITPEYILKRTIVTESAKDFPIDLKTLSEYLCDHCKDTLMTLNKIIFVNDLEKDFDELDGDEEFSEIMEVNDLPYDNLGIMWFEPSMIVINLGEHAKCVQKMVDDYPGEFDYGEEFNTGVVITILHELRHLYQNNMYAPFEVDPIDIEEDAEEDAEEYAIDIYKKYPITIIKDNAETEIER